jgi:hypothetical protein
MKRVNDGLRAWALAAVVVGALAVPASAGAEEARQAGRDAGIGLATVVANIFYIPAKVGYAAVGGITGGLTYALTAGNLDAAQKVWVASGGGDYVLSPEQLQGRERIHFSGGSTARQPAYGGASEF